MTVDTSELTINLPDLFPIVQKEGYDFFYRDVTVFQEAATTLLVFSHATS